MAKANGGQVIVAAMQVGDFGHMAVVTDPSGAAIGVWQPLEMPGFATRGEDGAPAWFELLTSDYDAVLPFYANVFGWDIHTMSDTPEFRYSTLGKDEHALAGIMDATAMLAGRPSYWNFYVQVADTDAALAKAVELGGSELMAAGRHALRPAGVDRRPHRRPVHGDGSEPLLAPGRRLVTRCGGLPRTRMPLAGEPSADSPILLAHNCGETTPSCLEGIDHPNGREGGWTPCGQYS